MSYALYPRRICDRDRVRTCNPQSRNLIFYPVELRSQITNFNFFLNSKFQFFKLWNLKFFIRFYTKSFFTIAEMVFPSAVPPN